MQFNNILQSNTRLRNPVAQLVVGLHRPCWSRWWYGEYGHDGARCNVGRWNNGTTRELQTCVTPVNRPQAPDTLYKKVAFFLSFEHKATSWHVHYEFSLLGVLNYTICIYLALERRRKHRNYQQATAKSSSFICTGQRNMHPG